MFFTYSIRCLGRRAPCASRPFSTLLDLARRSSSPDIFVGSRSGLVDLQHARSARRGRRRRAARRDRGTPRAGRARRSSRRSSSCAGTRAAASRPCGRSCRSRSSADAPVAHHEQVAAVQVAVEDAVDHRAFEERDHQRAQHRGGVDAGRAHRRRRRRARSRRGAPSPARGASPARVRPRHDHDRRARRRAARARCRACSRPRAGSRAPRRSSRRTARPAPAGSRAPRPGCGRPGTARSRPSRAMSRRTSRSTDARCTFTTTSSPRAQPRACTCAIDADARQVSSKRAKTSSSGRPSSASTDARTTRERLGRNLVAQRA